MQRAWAEVDLSQLKRNIQTIKGKLASGVTVMAIVKADGYGHGAVEISKAALAAGASMLGVAWVAEALVLRQAEIAAPILVLTEPVSDEALRVMVELKLQATVYSEDFVQKLGALAQTQKQVIDVHIKIDTGMGRVGVAPADARPLLQLIRSQPFLKLAGVCTHFACADEPENPFTAEQLGRFERVLGDLEELMGRRGEGARGRAFLVHVANSSGTRYFPQAHYDMVRIGLDLYRDVLTFKTRVAQVKTVAAGQPLSYGGIYTTPRATQIATLSAGYADGVERLLSNRGQVLIAGQRYPIVGRVTMDMILVDLGPDAKVARGAEAVLIGQSGSENISMDEVASECGTIPYEIMCGIGKRVPRIYLG